MLRRNIAQRRKPVGSANTGLTRAEQPAAEFVRVWHIKLRLPRIQARNYLSLCSLAYSNVSHQEELGPHDEFHTAQHGSSQRSAIHSANLLAYSPLTAGREDSCGIRVALPEVRDAISFDNRAVSTNEHQPLRIVSPSPRPAMFILASLSAAYFLFGLRHMSTWLPVQIRSPVSFANTSQRVYAMLPVMRSTVTRMSSTIPSGAGD